MTKEITFQCENSVWLAILPEWEGPLMALSMVAGADTLLDWIGCGAKTVVLQVSDETLHDGFVLTSMGEKGDYLLEHYKDEERDVEIFDHTLWLCGVCSWLFGKYPDEIWFKVIRINEELEQFDWHQSSVKGTMNFLAKRVASFFNTPD